MNKPIRNASAAEKRDLVLKLAATQAEAARANKRAAELEAITSPRRLSGEQNVGLMSLVRYRDSFVDVVSHANDGESAILATQICDALGRAGIVLIDNRGTVQATGVPLFGICVTGTHRGLAHSLTEVLMPLHANTPIQSQACTISYNRVHYSNVAATITVGRTNRPLARAVRQRAISDLQIK